MALTQNAAGRVDIRLFDSTGAAVTGVVTTDVLGGTVQLTKSDGTTALLTLVAAGGGQNWFEVDAANSPGLYQILIDAGNTAVLGVMTYSVMPAATKFSANGVIGSDTVKHGVWSAAGHLTP